MKKQSLRELFKRFCKPTTVHGGNEDLPNDTKYDAVSFEDPAWKLPGWDDSSGHLTAPVKPASTKSTQLDVSANTTTIDLTVSNGSGGNIYECDNWVTHRKGVRVYKLTRKTKIVDGVTLYRIKSLSNFADVKKGDLGGWVESERNLYGDGTAWVYDNACAYGCSRVTGNACVRHNARVYGDARINDNSQIYGNAQMYEVSDSNGTSQVFGSACVYGNARVNGNSKVFGNARVYGAVRVNGNSRVSGYANVYAPYSVEDDSFYEFGLAARLLGFPDKNWRSKMTISKAQLKFTTKKEFMELNPDCCDLVLFNRYTKGDQQFTKEEFMLDPTADDVTCFNQYTKGAQVSKQEFIKLDPTSHEVDLFNKYTKGPQVSKQEFMMKSEIIALDFRVCEICEENLTAECFAYHDICEDCSTDNAALMNSGIIDVHHKEAYKCFN